MNASVASTATPQRVRKTPTLAQEANQARLFLGKVSTDYRLVKRSRYIKPATADRLREEIRLLLESGIFTYPPTLRGLGIDPDMPLRSKKIRLGVEDQCSVLISEREQKFLEHMKQSSYTRRQTEWRWRISNHAEEMDKRGWYPFFVTLTVDQANHDGEELWKSGRPFRKYIRSLVKVACKELGHKPAHKTNTPESEYVTYCGMIEHGKSRQHHHGHFLIWMREIPERWKHDPNAGIANPSKRTNRECKQMRRFWKYSRPYLSPHLYFRSINDVWSRLEKPHVLPVDKNGQAVRIGSPRQSGGYITKYMAKDFKEWAHRMKATRNLGMLGLRNKLNQLPDNQIEALTWRPKDLSTHHSMTMTHTCPLGLLRREAKSIHFARQFHQNRLDLKSSIDKDYEIFLRMRQSVRNGARPDRMALREFYDWVSKLLPDIDGYCKDLLHSANQELAELFPRNQQQLRTAIGANEVGYA